MKIPGLMGQELLYGDGHENADAGNHDHHFDQRKILVLARQFIKYLVHLGSLLCTAAVSVACGVHSRHLL